MLTEIEARWLIEDGHLELVKTLNLLNSAVPKLLEAEQIEELHTLLVMSFSVFNANLEAIEMGLKYSQPSSVQKLT